MMIALVYDDHVLLLEWERKYDEDVDEEWVEEVDEDNSSWRNGSKQWVVLWVKW